MVEKASSISDSDKDREPIRFSEEFRKAKRNALFWSMVTMLLALGLTNGSNEIEVYGIVRHLTFPHGLLLSSSLAVLVFMTLGFRRAQIRLRSNHSDFAVAHRLSEAAEVADTLFEKVTTTLQGAGELDAHIQDRLERMKSLADAEISNISQVKVSLQNVKEDKLDGFLKGNAPLEIKEISSAAKKCIEAVDYAQRSIESTIGNILRNMDPKQTPRPLPELTKEGGALAVNTDELAELSKSLRVFSDAIGKGERRWLFWYDEVPVYGLAAVATIFAAMRLYWLTV